MFASHIFLLSTIGAFVVAFPSVGFLTLSLGTIIIILNFSKKSTI